MICNCKHCLRAFWRYRRDHPPKGYCSVLCFDAGPAKAAKENPLEVVPPRPETVLTEYRAHRLQAHAEATILRWVTDCNLCDEFEADYAASLEYWYSVETCRDCRRPRGTIEGGPQRIDPGLGERLMPCHVVKLPNGGTAIVRTAAPRGRRCTVCQQKVREYKLCDYVVRSEYSSQHLVHELREGHLLPAVQTVTRPAKTCDLVLCPSCAVHVEPDTDYCPRHANALGITGGGCAYEFFSRRHTSGEAMAGKETVRCRRLLQQATAWAKRADYLRISLTYGSGLPSPLPRQSGPGLS